MAAMMFGRRWPTEVRLIALGGSPWRLLRHLAFFAPTPFVFVIDRNGLRNACLIVVSVCLIVTSGLLAIYLAKPRSGVAG